MFKKVLHKCRYTLKQSYVAKKINTVRGMCLHIRPSLCAQQIYRRHSITCACTCAPASAHMVLENMDREADPCENFYEFACGGFEKRVVIPDDKSSRYWFKHNASKTNNDKNYKCFAKPFLKLTMSFQVVFVFYGVIFEITFSYCKTTKIPCIGIRNMPKELLDRF